MTVVQLRPGRVQGRLRAPPSKSYTHRALVAAFLSRRNVSVVDPLDSEDTRATLHGLKVLGASVRRTPGVWRVGPGRFRRARQRVIQCGESGTTLRFLTSVAALGSEPVRFEGGPRLSVRPMGELYRALRGLGADIHEPARPRALPCTIQGPIHAGRTQIAGDVSSQYTSSLLMTLPTLDGDSELRVTGRRVSEPYIDATCAVLRERGVSVRRRFGRFEIHGNQRFRGGAIRVPGDASSAAYFWAAAAITSGSVDVVGIPKDLPQADLAILSILARMGARVHRSAAAIRVRGPMTRSVSVNLTDTPDLYPLVAVLTALIPRRRSELSGAPHIQFKESDRRSESIRLARSLGATVRTTPAGIEIVGSKAARPLHLTSLTDHRLVMSAAVAALAAPGVSRVGRAETVAKSFPGFWQALGSLINRAETVP